MDKRTDTRLDLLLRILRFPVVLLGLLYVVLGYLYVAGYFFRASIAKGPLQGVAASLLSAVLMLSAYAVIAHVIERRKAGELSLPGMGREFGLGLLLGAGLYTACILVLMALGLYRIEGFNTWQVVLPGMAIVIATGVYEELLFRGGVFRLAEEWFGSWAALAISSLLFGFIHLQNPGSTLQGAVFISIEAGVLLAAAYMLTRRLWLSIGFHMAWNFTQGTIFSGSVSGNGVSQGVLKATLDGPELLTGGSFGLEASLPAFVLCTATGVILVIMAVRRGHIVPPRWKRRA